MQIGGIALLALLACGQGVHEQPNRILATATAEIQIRVVRFALITTMRVQPRVLQPRSAGPGPRHLAGGAHVLVKVDMPGTISPLHLAPDSITINGQHVRCVRQRSTHAPGARKVHLRRNDFLRALHGATGTTTVTLQAEIDGGHTLYASDTITVLPIAGHSGNQQSNGGEHGRNQR